MSIYHENRINVPGFKEYELGTFTGNLYAKGTDITMIPLKIKDVNVYKSKYGKYLMITKLNNSLYYTVTNEKSYKNIKPEKLSINTKEMYEATITLKFIEHKKHFQHNEKGIQEAIKWANDLEKLYYPEDYNTYKN